MTLESLETPSLVLDIDRVKRNATRMAQHVSELGSRLRPHVKTHKCVEIGRLQTAGHSGAITVSTLAEARAFAAKGFADITYAIPIEPGKFNQAIELSRNCERLNLLTDDDEVTALLTDAARRAGVTVNLFLKVDCGYHRCGVQPDSAEVLAIPRQISDSRNLRFAGILTHAGHSYHCRTREERLAVARQERDVMLELAQRLRASGVEVPTVSIGSTPTITAVDHLDGIDEARPGNYIFFDAFQASIGSCDIDDCALTVLAAVIHRDLTRGKIIVDAGALALSKDRGPIEFEPECGYGQVLDLAGNDLGLKIGSLSQEHGEISDVRSAALRQLKVGTRIRILANHSCLTAAQYSHYNVSADDRIVDRWEIHRGW
jgi:D-serine deaminase-like pyridoxal phosphate-dependent protein